MTDIFQEPNHMSTATATAASFNNDTTTKQVHPDYAKVTTHSNNTKNETDSAVSQLLARLDEVSRLLLSFSHSLRLLFFTPLIKSKSIGDANHCQSTVHPNLENSRIE
jgi:hypothetical protein